MNTIKPIAYGLAAAIALLGAYFAIVSAVSGPGFARSQWSEYRLYLALLSTGFGTQVGLYSWMRSMARAGAPKGVVAATGATSTVSMVACCTHYVANLLPALGIGALATLAAQYQVRLFWLGIGANLLGIAYLSMKARILRKTI